jgi:hypothetical protein
MIGLKKISMFFIWKMGISLNPKLDIAQSKEYIA